MTKLGYQIPNFTYPGTGPDGLFEAVARQAEAADRSGFDTVLVMDHFYQLPLLGRPDDGWSVPTSRSSSSPMVRWRLIGSRSGTSVSIRYRLRRPLRYLTT